MAASRLLIRFMAQEISPSELEDEWPESQDIALTHIADAVWYLYDDVRDDLYRPTASGDDLLRRCIDFLRCANLEYGWPVMPFWLRLLGVPLNLVTFGLANRLLSRKYQVPLCWPFASDADREHARAPHGDRTGLGMPP